MTNQYDLQLSLAACWLPRDPYTALAEQTGVGLRLRARGALVGWGPRDLVGPVRLLLLRNVAP